MNTLNVQQNSITNNMVSSTNMIPMNNHALSLFSNLGNNYDRTEMIYLNNAPDPTNTDMWIDPNFCNSVVAKNNSINSFSNSNLDLLGFLSSGLEINSNSDNFVDYPLTNASIINHKNGLTLSKTNFPIAVNNDQSMPPALVQNVNRPVINQIILDRNITMQENNSIPAISNLTHLSPSNLLHENNINNANDLQFPENLINSTADLSGLDCLNVLGNSGCDRDVPESGHWENISLIAQSVPEMISEVDNIQSSPFTSQNSSLEDLPNSIFAQMVDELVTYKCKFCSSIYVTFSRDEMISHLKSIHEKEFMISLKQTSMPVISQSTPLPPWNTVSNCNTNFMNKESNQNIQSNHQISGNPNISQPSANYACSKCPKVFSVVDELEKHSFQCHTIPTQISAPVSKPQTLLHKSTSQHSPIVPLPNQTINSHPPIPPRPNKLPTIAPKLMNNTSLPPPISNKNGSIEKPVTQANPVKRKRPMTPLKKSSRDRQNAQQGCYICEFKGCNVRFRSIENLEYHRKCHTNGKMTATNSSSGASFACPECNFECLTWNSMSGHVWRRHFIDLELHACDQCSFRTYSLSKLENLHKRTHSTKRPYVCPKCNMNFKTYKLLWGHKKKCMDIPSAIPKRKPVNCSICNSQFAREYLLTIHLETVHYKVRPYLCQVCGYSANRPTTLKMHMRQHSGEKPFACELCMFKTADHNTLRRHNMTHSGEYKYKCLYCPYSCIQSTTYRSHLRKKHPREKDGLMFTCKLCNFQTVNEQLLNVHTASHKPEENNSSCSSGTTALNSQTESQSSHTNQSQDSLADNQIISLVQAVQFSIHDREIT